MPNWKKVLTSGSAGELASLFATSITGSLLGTASFAISASRAISALSSSFATTASFAQTASYSQNLQISGSINNVDYIDFDTTNIIGTNAPAWKEGRVFYDSGSGALAVYNWEQDVTLNVGQEQWLRARNQTGVTITNGSVVRLLGAIGDRPTIALAVATDQTNTFSTGNEIIGIATHDIETGTDGFVTTFGLVNGLNTAAYTVGDLLWVSQSAGQFTNVAPPTPFDRTFVGIVTRVNASNGSVFSTPLTPIHFHDISSVSASVYQQGDLWMYRSGSAGQANAWINTKALSGSYDITGSLTVSGSSRVIGTLNADGVQFIRQYNNNGNWFGGSLSVGKSVGATATLDVSGSAIITGSLNVAAGITGSGLLITGSTSNDLVRITQTGAGNAFVVEDSANPDTSPFVINNNGSVGIGTTTPTYQLDIKSNDPQLRVYADTNNRAFRLIPSNGTIESDNTSFYINRISTNDILLGIGGGNVGIGTTTPGAKLTVSASGVDGILIGTDTSAGNSQRSARLLFGQQDTTKSTSIYAISGSMAFATSASYNVTSGLTRMFISESGDIGIGTTQPTLAKLQVAGNVHATSFTGSGLLITGSTSTDLVRITQTGTGNSFVVEDSTNPDSSPFVISSSGNVGIGTTAPSRLLSVNGVFGVQFSDATESFAVNPTSTGVDFVIKNASNPTLGEFRVDARIGQRAAYYNGGNFTIGSIADDGINKLQVIGSARITNGLVVTSSLTIKGAGVSGAVLDTDTNDNFQSTRLFFKMSGSGNDVSMRNFSGSLLVATQATSGVSSGTTTAMFISSSGNVAIGNTQPTLGNLQVLGNVYATSFTGSLLGTATSAITASYVNPLNQDVIITGSLTVGSGSRTLITSINTGSNTFILNSSANLGLAAGSGAGIAFTVNNGAAAMYITSIGQTLIGNPRVNPIENGNATLHVTNVGTQNSFLVEDSTNPDTSPFLIDNVGNVAIGTGSAFEKVTIQNGNIALKDSTSSTQTSIVFTASDTSSRNYITTLNSSSANDDYMKVGSWFGSVHLTTGNITSPTTHLFVSRSGNIGVGITSSLNAKLHVNNTGPDNSFLVEDSANPDSNPFVVDTSGNVGIGTTTPTTLLHISGSTANLVSIERNGGANSHIQYKNTNTAMWAGLSPAGNFAIGNGIDLSTNSQLTVVSTSGNVGIGISSPSRILHTSGSTNVTSVPLFEGMASSETRFLTIKRTDGTAEAFINYTGVDLAFGANGRERLRIGRYGEIAIGITSSGAGARVYITGNDEAGNESGVNPRTTPLLIASASSNTDLVRFTQTGTGNSFVVEDTNTPDSSKFVIDNVGNVGIGTTTPNSKLEVNGNTIITGSLNVSNSITASAYTTNDALITSTTLTANTGITTIYSIPTASYDGAWFDYTIRSGSNARAGTIFGMWSGSAVNYAETTTTDFGSTSNFTFGMSINGSNMILSSSATTNGWTVNSIIRSI